MAEPKSQVSAPETPSKDAIKENLRQRIEALNSRLVEFEDLQRERDDLKAALRALEGDSSSRTGTKNSGRKRGTRKEVEARRARVVELLNSNPSIPIRELADELGVGYQTAANDIRLLKSNGDLPD